MANVEWLRRPILDDPVALVAFTGWGDAGEAASQALVALLENYDSEMIAVIDSDDLYDFQVRRPMTEFDEDGERLILWPDIEIHVIESLERDLVVVLADEPHYHWKTFSQELAEVFRSLGVSRVVMLGAFVGQVAHTLPVPLVGSSNRPEAVAAWGLLPSSYEGPTGIVGVLTNVLGDMGIETIAVWAAVPHYLSSQDYPPGTRALLRKASELLGIGFDLSALDTASLEYLSTVDEAIQANSDLVAYVRQLEEEADDLDLDDTSRLVEEIEDFLREQS
ncbi:MAG: PAC2 family protein [Actinomycetes bacterium]|jgi:predicted ATP-grasp superfamily ATP-dependent carboligase|nr:MAG: carboxylate--amine ligase [Actinomycetota bacterium]